jgi:hypothetical protein
MLALIKEVAPPIGGRTQVGCFLARAAEPAGEGNMYKIGARHLDWRLRC